MTLNENQLQDTISLIYEEEKYKILEERFNLLDKYEKKFLVEFLNYFYSKKITLNEDDDIQPEKKSNFMGGKGFMHTLADVLGIFDPTGIVDATNSFFYFKEGDILFGFLSLISAIPLIGDLIGKPLILTLKGSSRAGKLMRAARGSSDWAKLGQNFPLVRKLLDSMSTIGPGVKKVLQNFPGGKSFVKHVDRYVDMLTDASKIGSKAASRSRFFGGGKLIRSDFTVFRDFGIKPEWSWARRMWSKGLLHPFFGRNIKLSLQLSKTKFWLGLLDWMGVANFVGPQEMIEKLGEDEFNKRLGMYMDTPEARRNWEEEMSQIPSSGTKSQEDLKKQQEADSDPLGEFFDEILGLR